ncbi:MAG: glycosyltransferase [Chitinivibrionales bacterium]|nr:glycosyltransferase [Chitinivibrionales bacterium]
MRFLVYKKSLDSDFLPKTESSDAPAPFIIADHTSVKKVSHHFFSSLETLGPLICMEDLGNKDAVQKVLQEPDVIVAISCVVDPTYEAILSEIPHRKLILSLGKLMMPQQVALEIGLRNPSRVHLVSSDFQKRRLSRFLRDAAPFCAAFAHELDNNQFFPPTPEQKLAARRALGLRPEERHIVYAGRFLANKGICQVLRALFLWPLDNITITLAGNFCPGFGHLPTHATNFTFENYFKREFRSDAVPYPAIQFLPAQEPPQLQKLLWSADCFVYPSFHDDENFGLAVREAALCGVPCVTTDFCGLHALAVLSPESGVATYPTAIGVRYSLRQLRNSIAGTLDIKDKAAAVPWNAVVRAESDPRRARDLLERVCKGLIGQAPALPEPLEESAVQNRVFEQAHDGFLQPLYKAHPQSWEGLFADGCAPCQNQFPHNQMLRAVQGMYTTSSGTPVVSDGSSWRGFFRLSLCKETRWLMEFGFPGPRLKPYDRADWDVLTGCAIRDDRGDIIFKPTSARAAEILQELVEMGYLVPDEYFP